MSLDGQIEKTSWQLCRGQAVCPVPPSIVEKYALRLPAYPGMSQARADKNYQELLQTSSEMIFGGCDGGFRGSAGGSHGLVAKVGRGCRAGTSSLCSAMRAVPLLGSDRGAPREVLKPQELGHAGRDKIKFAFFLLVCCFGGDAGYGDTSTRLLELEAFLALGLPSVQCTTSYPRIKPA